MRWYPDEQACAAGKPKGALAFGTETTCTLWTQAEQQQLTIAEGKKRLTLRASRFEDLAEWREKVQAVVESGRVVPIASRFEAPLQRPQSSGD